MPCTYCSNPKHTRKQCSEIAEDYRVYLAVSETVRQEYAAELSDKGIVPDAVVRTYNRTSNFMNTSSEVKVDVIGPLDMFDCYIKVGRQTFANKMPTKEHIILGDDDDRMVGMNHCYEVVQNSDRKWSPDDFTVPLMSNDEFLAMFKGKKRHVAFEKTLHNCVVKRCVDGEESVEEMVARLNAKMKEEEEAMKSDKGEPIYVVTAVATTDDYKRPYSDTETVTATSLAMAEALAARMYLQRCDEWDVFDFDKDRLEKLAGLMADTSTPAATAYEFFQHNEDALFEGEYVPKTFEITISEQETDSCTDDEITDLVNELVGRVLEG